MPTFLPSAASRSAIQITIGVFPVPPVVRLPTLTTLPRRCCCLKTPARSARERSRETAPYGTVSGQRSESFRVMRIERSCSGTRLYVLACAPSHRDFVRKSRTQRVPSVHELRRLRSTAPRLCRVEFHWKLESKRETRGHN